MNKNKNLHKLVEMLKLQVKLHDKTLEKYKLMQILR
jgi:hypothetical protein